ncbi:hypothetical protein [Dyadobacter sp. 676]|uniref:DUF1573 domain-containing protein n=1 Tax=Dyadobacter sp. 676 TaxID=3088362 RepID=A0AAU8FPL1_9BACT
MKTRRFLTLCFGMAAAMVACKEEKVDSPEITVLAPRSHQVVADKDSVQIEAIFRPKGASVSSYSMTVKTKNNKWLFNTQRSCQCDTKDSVKVKTSFYYDINKTSDVFLEIKAMLDDGREIAEKIPFVLTD